MSDNSECPSLVHSTRGVDCALQQCKGPGVGACLTWLKKAKKPVWLEEVSKGKEVGDEGRIQVGAGN